MSALMGAAIFCLAAAAAAGVFFLTLRNSDKVLSLFAVKRSGVLFVASALTFAALTYILNKMSPDSRFDGLVQIAGRTAAVATAAFLALFWTKVCLFAVQAARRPQ